MRALEQLPNADLEKLAQVAFSAEQASGEGSAAFGPPEFWSWLRATSWWHIARRRGLATADEPTYPSAMEREGIEAAELAVIAMMDAEALKVHDQAEDARPALIGAYAELVGGLILQRHAFALGAGEVTH